MSIIRIARLPRTRLGVALLLKAMGGKEEEEKEVGAQAIVLLVKLPVQNVGHHPPERPIEEHATIGVKREVALMVPNATSGTALSVDIERPVSAVSETSVDVPTWTSFKASRRRLTR